MFKSSPTHCSIIFSDDHVTPLSVEITITSLASFEISCSSAQPGVKATSNSSSKSIPSSINIEGEIIHSKFGVPRPGPISSFQLSYINERGTRIKSTLQSSGSQSILSLKFHPNPIFPTRSSVASVNFPVIDTQPGTFIAPVFSFIMKSSATTVVQGRFSVLIETYFVPQKSFEGPSS
jgi:hypothetical protein